MTSLAFQRCDVRVPGEDGAPPLKLEARRVQGSARAAAVVAPPHPLYGGTLHNPVVIGIAEGLLRAGIGSLSFNWRGIDASEGVKTENLAAAVADYRAALDALTAQPTPPAAALPAVDADLPLYAAGYSFGAATALLAAAEDSRVRGVILLAPPVGMLQRADLSAVRCPIAIIVGGEDEYAPLPALEAKLAGLAHAHLYVIAGADHFFHFGGLHEIADRVAVHAQSLLAGV